MYERVYVLSHRATIPHSMNKVLVVFGSEDVVKLYTPNGKIIGIRLEWAQLHLRTYELI